jgi:hypothetical protein
VSQPVLDRPAATSTSPVAVQTLPAAQRSSASPVGQLTLKDRPRQTAVQPIRRPVQPVPKGRAHKPVGHGHGKHH